MKPCPSCRRRIQDAASKCHYCGAIVRTPPALSGAEGRAEGEHQRKVPPDADPPPRIYAFRFTIAIVMIVAALVWLFW
jgi:hypothetical protein